MSCTILEQKSGQVWLTLMWLLLAGVGEAECHWPVLVMHPVLAEAECHWPVLVMHPVLAKA